LFAICHRTVSTIRNSNNFGLDTVYSLIKNMEISNQDQLRIVVGTTNPCKIMAVESAIRRILIQNKCEILDVHVVGCNVSSNVSNQPWNDDETKRGAVNRARGAYYYRHHDEEHSSNDDSAQEKLPHLAIGIEGGLEWENRNEKSTTTHQQQQLYCMAWIAVYGKQTKLTSQIFGSINSKDADSLVSSSNTSCCETTEILGLSKTAMFILPPSLSELIEQGNELGQADDTLFRRTNSKRSSGTVGLLTNGLLDRSVYYEHAILLALVPWMHPNLYPNGHTP
jgi:inosine/xanthosine triphosphatase